MLLHDTSPKHRQPTPDYCIIMILSLIIIGNQTSDAILHELKKKEVILSISMISIIDQTSDAILHELKKKEVILSISMISIIDQT